MNTRRRQIALAARLWLTFFDSQSQRPTELPLSTSLRAFPLCTRAGVENCRTVQHSTTSKELNQPAEAHFHLIGEKYWNSLPVEDPIERQLQYTSLASSGDLAAAVAAGYAHLSGKVNDTDSGEGLALLRQAAQRNRGDAKVLLALYYLSHESEQLMQEQARRWMVDAMTTGGATGVAHYVLGEYLLKADIRNALDLFHDEFTPQQARHEAFVHFLAGTVDGYIPSYHKLSSCFFNGHGIKRDEQEGVRWLVAASSRGYDASTYALAKRLILGAGIDQNPELGMKLLHDVADRGHKQAQYNLGLRYLHENGVEYNRTRAREYLSRSVEGYAGEDGWDFAVHGLMCREGLMGSSRRGEALAWYRKAAEKGNVHGLVALACMYLDEQYVKRDETMAVGLLRRALDVAYSRGRSKKSRQTLTDNGSHSTLKADDIQFDSDPEPLAELFSRAARLCRSVRYLPTDRERYLLLVAEAKRRGSTGIGYELAKAIYTGFIEVDNTERKLEIIFNEAKISAHAGLKKARLFLRQVDREVNLSYSPIAPTLSVGLASAQYQLGMSLIRKGEMAAEDGDSAFLFYEGVRWIRDAADSCYIPAVLKLGYCYLKGFGIQKDLCRAFDLFRQGSVSGDLSAINQVIKCYKNGIGVKRDKEKAVAWMKEAVKLGSMRATFNLAMVYQRGDLVERDLHTALILFKKAAEGGMSNAAYRVGLYYQKGWAGLSPDLIEAGKWYQRASPQDVRATSALGSLYLKGEGVEQDFRRARVLFEKAAERGYSSALASLGVIHENAYGVPKDMVKANEYYLEAGQKGHPLAEYKTSLNYLYGNTVAKDTTEALKWLRMAATKQHAPAVRLLKVLTKQGAFHSSEVLYPVSIEAKTMRLGDLS